MPDAARTIHMPRESHRHWRSARYRVSNDIIRAPVPDWLAEPMQGLFRRAMMDRIAPFVGPEPFTHALDLACGVGEWTSGYLAIARRATGVDINEEFVEAARRRAAAFGVADRLAFLTAPVESFVIGDDVDFVGLGACLMYFSDVDANRILERIAGKLRCTGLVYVRASVVTPLRRRHGNDVGVYRDEAEYETLFRANGLEVVDRAYSAAVVAGHIAARVESPTLRGAARTLIAGLGRAARTARHSTDFCNWLLRRAPGEPALAVAS